MPINVARTESSPPHRVEGARHHRARPDRTHEHAGLAADGVAAAHQVSARFGLSESAVLTSPNCQTGTGDEIAADLRCRRQEMGLTYIMVPELFLMGPWSQLAPAPERVAGT